MTLCFYNNMYCTLSPLCLPKLRRRYKQWFPCFPSNRNDHAKQHGISQIRAHVWVWNQPWLDWSKIQCEVFFFGWMIIKFCLYSLPWIWAFCNKLWTIRDNAWPWAQDTRFCIVRSIGWQMCGCSGIFTERQWEKWHDHIRGKENDCLDYSSWLCIENKYKGSTDQLQTLSDLTSIFLMSGQTFGSDSGC